MEPFEGGVIDDDEARLVMGEDWPFFFLFFSRLDRSSAINALLIKNQCF